MVTPAAGNVRAGRRKEDKPAARNWCRSEPQHGATLADDVIE